jgi:hypothetical protein
VSPFICTSRRVKPFVACLALICTPAFAQTYRHQVPAVFHASSRSAAPTPKTWHIRHDGGNSTQCTGLKNAPYPGKGTAQPCSYNHPYQMMNWKGGWTSFTTGDTMEFDDPPTNTTPYYFGEQNRGVGTDWHPTLSGICPGPNSAYPAGASCILPILPNGVTVKGQNYGSCHTAGHTGLVNPTVIEGINGIFAGLNVQGTNGVTISCVEITQPDNCTSAGIGFGPGQCSTSSNYITVAGLVLEYQTAQGPANLTLTDFAAVGLEGRGIMGSHLNRLSTDTFTASDIYIIGNGQAGWDGDGGGCGTSCESVGTMNVSYADIEWNGCLALKPYNIGISPETAPNSFNYCYGQSTSGYGDGFVQIAAGNLTLNMTHSMFKYNTQDGFDAAHLSDDANTKPATNISNSWAEGNAGQTFKIGAGASGSAINNVSIGNCRVLSQASTFPSNPKGWITLDYGDTCRAAGDQWSLTLRNNSSITLKNNTSLGYGTTMYDFECSFFNPSCGSNGAKIIFTNNISKGYPDPGNHQQLASGIYFGEKQGWTRANVTATNNLWHTMRTGCPNSTTPGETKAVCADPRLAGQSNIDAINPSLTSSSPTGLGATVGTSTPAVVKSPPPPHVTSPHAVVPGV